MQLLALQKDPHATPKALIFPSYMIPLGKDKLQLNEKDNTALPISEQLFRKQCLMVQHVFPNIEHNYRNVSWLTERAILTTKNVCVRNSNNLVSSRIPGFEREFLGADSIDEAVLNELNYPLELLNAFPGTTSLPDHKLCLKNGYIVMLAQNLQPEIGHVNGA